MANFVCVSPKVPNLWNLRKGLDLTMNNKHCNFSKWSCFRLDSFEMTYLLLSEWTAKNTDLPVYLPPIAWVTKCAIAPQRFLSLTLQFVVIYCHLTTWSNFETCQQIQANPNISNQWKTHPPVQHGCLSSKWLLIKQCQLPYQSSYHHTLYNQFWFQKYQKWQ
jgi:hypothetical protein